MRTAQFEYLGRVYVGMPLGDEGLVFCIAVLPLYTTYRLWAGYKLYLRFDHPLATAVAAQVVTVLLAITIWVQWEGP